MVTLTVGDRAESRKADEVITRIVNIPAMAVAPGWQFPMGMGQGNLPPGATNNPANPNNPNNPNLPNPNNPNFPNPNNPGNRLNKGFQ